MSTNQKNIYIHQNFNKNEIRDVLLQNSDWENRPIGMTGGDKGLLYFDTEINRILVWNGTEWKIVKYFDDRDYYNTESVFLEDIWALSSELKLLTENEAQGGTGSSQSIVQYYEEEETTRIPGSWSFHIDDPNVELSDIILPRDYGSASVPVFYEPVVKTQGGFCIPRDKYLLREYKKGNEKPTYRIEFKDGKYLNSIGIFPSVGTVVPPTITFYKYVGPKMSLSLVNGNVNKFEIYGSEFDVDPNDNNYYRVVLTPFAPNLTNVSNISSFSINGQELSSVKHYDIILESNTYYLRLNIPALNWGTEPIDNDDLFYLNTLNTY